MPQSWLGAVYVFLIFQWWRDIRQGFTWGCSAAAEVVVFHLHEELAFGADLLFSVPVRTCFDGVEALFVGYFV